MIRTEEPYPSSTPTTLHDWEESVYGKVKEHTPHDAPVQLVKHVVNISYHDANLFHNVITGRSVAGVLHVMNKIPMDWHSKKQSTVETERFASELLSA